MEAGESSERSEVSYLSLGHDDWRDQEAESYDSINPNACKARESTAKGAYLSEFGTVRLYGLVKLSPVPS